MEEIKNKNPNEEDGNCQKKAMNEEQTKCSLDDEKQVSNDEKDRGNTRGNTSQVASKNDEKPNNEAANKSDENVESEHYEDFGFRYLDHPADIQIHSWGDTLERAFEQQAVGMFGVITELDTIEIAQEENVEANGHDLESLLYNFLDECLFLFCAEPYLCACEVEITEFDAVNFLVKATLKGEPFDLSKHPQGTEVKAITYSNMQIHKKDTHCECYVIVDI